jgi:predicted Zn-dependent protease
LLEYLNDPYLLSELLRCSAVDDFEAAAAILALRQAGRNREAIKQAEEWQRMLPRSSVLAEHLFQLYIEDGWDEEALALAKSHYDLDPNSMWIEYLDQMNFPKAKELVSLWKMDDALK